MPQLGGNLKFAIDFFSYSLVFDCTCSILLFAGMLREQSVVIMYSFLTGLDLYIAAFDAIKLGSTVILDDLIIIISRIYSIHNKQSLPGHVYSDCSLKIPKQVPTDYMINPNATAW